VTDVLEVPLGVRVVGAEPPWLQQLALDHVDRLTEEMRRRTLPTVRTRSPAELLAGWVREPPRWGDDVRQLVQEALPSLHGDEGRLLAWALAEPEQRLRDLVVHGALLAVEAEEQLTQTPQPFLAAVIKAGRLSRHRRVAAVKRRLAVADH
jgi:hypothetical protein